MLKIFFHILNILIIFLYLFPGSFLGCIFYDDCKLQPQITDDFIISSNHFFSFIILSFLGLYSFQFRVNQVVFYLIFLATILEIFHLIIPNRSFELKDLFGNLIAVILSFIIFKILKVRRKNNEFF